MPGLPKSTRKARIKRQSKNGDQLLLTREVADQLGVSPATVVKWCKDGVLPALNLSEALGVSIQFGWRVKQSTIDALVAKAEANVSDGI